MCPEQREGEAALLARFSHVPGIVGYRDFVEENGTAYLVMDYVDGPNLKLKMSRMEGPFSQEKALELMVPILLAVGQMHSCHVIHRDVSPENLILGPDGKLTLIDFGAAREFSGGDENLTVILKRGYAPEEQYRSGSKQGPWTDIYACCAVLYQMVSGILPQGADERRVRDQVKPLDEIPGLGVTEGFARAIEKGMTIRAAERFPSMESCTRELDLKIAPQSQARNQSAVTEEKARNESAALKEGDENQSVDYSREQGEEAFLNQEYESAAEYFDEAASWNPFCQAAYEGMAAAYLYMGYREQALAALEEGTEWLKGEAGSMEEWRDSMASYKQPEFPGGWGEMIHLVGRIQKKPLELDGIKATDADGGYISIGSPMGLDLRETGGAEVVDELGQTVLISEANLWTGVTLDTLNSVGEEAMEEGSLYGVYGFWMKPEEYFGRGQWLDEMLFGPTYDFSRLGEQGWYLAYPHGHYVFFPVIIERLEN